MSEQVSTLLKEFQSNLEFLARSLNSRQSHQIADTLPELQGAKDVLLRLYAQHQEKLESHPELFKMLKLVHTHAQRFRAACEDDLVEDQAQEINILSAISTAEPSMPIENDLNNSNVMEGVENDVNGPGDTNVQFLSGSAEQPQEHSLESKLEKASLAAYNKLLFTSSSGSSAFKCFVQDLGSHDAFLARGMACFERFLNHETVSSLADVYGVLHVAYAVSQTERENPAKTTPAEFYAGIFTFRELLADTKSDDPQNTSDRELFDEIVDAMWDELDYAVAWIGKNTSFNWQFMVETSTKASRLKIAREILKGSAVGRSENERVSNPNFEKEVSDIPKDPCTGLEPSFVNEIRDWKYYGTGYDLITLTTKQLTHLRMSPKMRRGMSQKLTWWDIATSSVFVIIVGFLREVQNTPGAFRYMPNAAYMCFLYPDMDTNGTSLPEFRDFIARFTGERFAPRLEQWISPPSVPVVYKTLIEVALFLVTAGTIQSIRHFGCYLFGMRKYIGCSRSDELSFILRILHKLYQSSCSLRSEWPHKIKTPWELSNGAGYISELLDDMMETEPIINPGHASEQNYQSPLPGELDHEVVENEQTTSKLTAGDIPSPGSGLLVPSTIANAEHAMVANLPLTEESNTLASTSGTSTSTTFPLASRSTGTAPRRRRRGRRVVNLQCNEVNCVQFNHQFANHSNLRRHNIRYHALRSVVASFPCPHDQCFRRYNRQDNLSKHIRNAHGDA